MSFLTEFKKFLLRGNVLDLAIGVVIGAAFTAVVNAIADDMLSPIIQWAFPYSFENLFVHLRCPNQPDGKCVTPYNTLKDAKKDGAIVFAYGHAIEQALQFFFTAFILFLILRLYMRLKHASPAPEDKKCPHCIQNVNAKATRCQHCGGALTTPTVDVSVKAM